MTLAEAAKKDSMKTYTENGAQALKSTGDAVLDLFGTIGALREADELRIQRLFAEAFKEDPLLATKTVFYGRDVRGGLGERQTFRTLIRYMANRHPETLRPNLDLIGVYGRYDDLYALIGTRLEEDMWKVMKDQLNEDLRNRQEGKAVSLLAKWIKSPSNRNREAHRLGKLTAEKLGYSEYTFKRIITDLRRHIGVIEILMTEGKWDEIKYPEVPSRAMALYRKAFLKHDEERFGAFTDKAVNGEVKIHAGTLYPYDLVGKVMHPDYIFKFHEDEIAEAQWRQLPDYVGNGMNAVVIADTSGSMMGQPIRSALGLAVYFAERNKGAYHNLWMTFSLEPSFQVLKGETLAQKLQSMDMNGWGMNTDLKAAFEKILELAVQEHVPAQEMPVSLIVISDMEIDACCANRDWLFYDEMRDRFREAGYEIPNIVFWNVQSRNDVFHVDAKRKGVQLCSGQSASTFRNLMGSVGMTPEELMRKILNQERYAAITVDPVA